MNVSLPTELEAWIDDRVRSGHFAAPGDVVLEALLRLKDREAFREMKLAAIRADLEVARLESEQGHVSPLDMEDVIRRGIERRRSGGRTE